MKKIKNEKGQIVVVSIKKEKNRTLVINELKL